MGIGCGCVGVFGLLYLVRFIIVMLIINNVCMGMFLKYIIIIFK